MNDVTIRKDCVIPLAIIELSFAELVYSLQLGMVIGLQHVHSKLLNQIKQL